MIKIITRIALELHLHALVAIVTVIRHNSSCTYVQTGGLCSIDKVKL